MMKNEDLSPGSYSTPFKVMKSQMPEGKGVPGVATRPAGNRGLPVLPFGGFR